MTTGRINQISVVCVCVVVVCVSFAALARAQKIHVVVVTSFVVSGASLGGSLRRILDVFRLSDAAVSSTKFRAVCFARCVFCVSVCVHATPCARSGKHTARSCLNSAVCCVCQSSNGGRHARLHIVCLVATCRVVCRHRLGDDVTLGLAVVREWARVAADLSLSIHRIRQRKPTRAPKNSAELINELSHYLTLRLTVCHCVFLSEV